MPGTNQFLPFAVGAGANTLTPTAYAALTSLLSGGFVAGVANSAQFNTALRQATTAAAGLAEFIANQNINVNDDGSKANFAAGLTTALQALFAPRGAGISAWVTFNGFTGVIWASRNVASITKIDVGTYELNFTTAMSSALYGVAGSSGELDGTSSSASNPGGNNIVGGTGPVGSLAVRTAAKVRVYCWEAGTAQRIEDSQLISVVVFGG